MFEAERARSSAQSAFATLELIFHASVRHVRQGHGNAVIGLLLNMVQTVVLVLVFYTMMTLMGSNRAAAVRGNFVLYVMSGVFMFMTHSKALGAVAGAEGPTSAMMKHAPMNTIVSIASSALSSLYLQLLSASCVLYGYHAAFTPITIHDPVGAMAMMLLSWASGVAIGMIFLAAKPWAPDIFGVVTMVYMRANMIASGKMLIANQAPHKIRQWFDWNPLFHTIDQGRGFVFMNYHPHYTSIAYALKVTCICFVIGMMAEFYTRKHISASWFSKR
ncbi:ABC transporter permease [Gemmobacter lutimaris]|uniref:ABC transporter permease n=1 Tax=Gemmobacter lutimaris TaxID=2306023 RepID=A0A398BH94_9RHOB|nr:ABC transporter permease [Gemmobacter lutimaris]RID89839.1 ABC transporter permease [Gemmobacter lutimaris]